MFKPLSAVGLLIASSVYAVELETQLESSIANQNKEVLEVSEDRRRRKSRRSKEEA